MSKTTAREFHIEMKLKENNSSLTRTVVGKFLFPKETFIIDAINHVGKTPKKVHHFKKYNFPHSKIIGNISFIMDFSISPLKENYVYGALVEPSGKPIFMTEGSNISIIEVFE